jgi:hypothetical protein
MGDCDAAQAVELIRALRDHLREMTRHLARVDGRDVPGTNGHATRSETAALRRDIAEAQMYIDRLYRRYSAATGTSSRPHQRLFTTHVSSRWQGIDSVKTNAPSAARS